MKDLAPWIEVAPEYESVTPVISLVVPALNEEITIGEFVCWCKEGLQLCGISGEIIIVDSSSDNTPSIALRAGANVLHVPKLGLGRAYIDAIPFVRGKWVIMGDVDLTYDFRELRGFVSAFQAGSEFIMGSRFRGRIEQGSMPPLHRWFGTPATTWLLNLMYGTKYSDIHCGMRGVSKAALQRMQLKSQSWEYASEMIIKASHLKLRCDEVPINFYKDRSGRESHLKRIGWIAPWQAGWLTLKVFFTYGADVLLIKPGLILFSIGLIGVLLLTAGPVVIFGLGLSLHWMLLFVLALLVGLHFLLGGIIASLIYDIENKRTQITKRYFDLNKVALISGGVILVSLGLEIPLLRLYIADGFRLPNSLSFETYAAVSGIAFSLAAFIFFTSSLIIQAVLARFDVNKG